MLSLYTSLALSLLLTLLFELGFALLWSMRVPSLRSTRELLLVALVNLLTNPMVVLLSLTALARWHSVALWLILALELCAVLAEGFCYRACSRALRHPFWFSLCANLVSFFCGLLLGIL